MRLDKFLSHQLMISRKNAGQELKAGKVTVDNIVIMDKDYKISPEQKIVYNGQSLHFITQFRYFMLNKPAGYVCSTDDPIHPTVFHFINEPMTDKLHAAGRLDLDTTGLVLLTDDGQWSHRVTAPRHHCEKGYSITVDTPLVENLIEQFAKGIQLNHEKYPTKPAKLIILDDYHAHLTIHEGRYHQVKRMFAALGYHVCSLHRHSIGEITLDPSLTPGEYRFLTTTEIECINL